MINELTWDSDFFKRRIGELKIVSKSPRKIEFALKNAKLNNFKYIICKIPSQHTALIKTLENLGFYLSDIGVTWAIETDKFLYKDKIRSSLIRKSLKIATEKDISMLKKMIKSLFLESRFYSDPFFSKDEADRLYQVWIENSVKGKIADVVFCIPEKGFITCKKSSPTMGEIPLIGIRKDFRGKGLGTIFIDEAIKWFKTQDIHFVSIRTQLKNITAMNFYVKLGFYIKGYDTVFAKAL
ncbi:MAG: GNAT family N-acetyltransferase [Nitrospirota bacterium]|nr:GNAT family N-acetyltransferase [Nitrospirota bacterium]MDH5769227.1 GNAT family N-acetyltransferase [Nitrospirota bacterium]